MHSVAATKKPSVSASSIYYERERYREGEGEGEGERKGIQELQEKLGGSGAHL